MRVLSMHVFECVRMCVNMCMCEQMCVSVGACVCVRMCECNYVRISV